MSLVPLPEWSSIDLDDGTLDESLGSEKLVVGGVVDLLVDETRRNTVSLPMENNHLPPIQRRKKDARHR